MKKVGILMPISALPGKYGIGDFGETTYEFIDLIKKTNFSYWQILPLNPLGFSNSPYQSFSSKAIDEIYVSLDQLEKDGLIGKVEGTIKSNKVEFEIARKIKTFYLHLAFKNFHKNDDYFSFISQKWVREYAIFITFKKRNNMTSWNTWPKEYKEYYKTEDISLYNKHLMEIEYEMFAQYILYKQFSKLKEYTNSKGIEIIGDLPFYVGLDSSDVYFNQNNFTLDYQGEATWIAGAPPDDFSKEGQRWGNPMYDWNYLKKHDFEFWFDRINYNSNLYDVLRIDHFRAFDNYWLINAADKNASNGIWVDNCGYEFFTKLFKKYPNIKIIAEDLGSDLRESLFELERTFNIPSMNVIIHSFFEKTKENQVIYTGTHDNETATYWYKHLNEKEQSRVKEYLDNHYPGYCIGDALLMHALMSNAKIVIIPYYDLIHDNDNIRINTPGTIGSPNWEYKINSYDSFIDRMNIISKMILKSLNR